jgi:hypothetical protein
MNLAEAIRSRLLPGPERESLNPSFASSCIRFVEVAGQVPCQDIAVAI